MSPLVSINSIVIDEITLSDKGVQYVIGVDKHMYLWSGHARPYTRIIQLLLQLLSSYVLCNCYLFYIKHRKIHICC